MLDELGGEDPAERTVGLLLEVDERVGLRHVEALPARESDHVGVRIDSLRRDPRVLQEPEKFAPAGADVEYGRVGPKVIDVHTLPLANVGADQPFALGSLGALPASSIGASSPVGAGSASSSVGSGASSR